MIKYFLKELFGHLSALVIIFIGAVLIMGTAYGVFCVSVLITGSETSYINIIVAPVIAIFVTAIFISVLSTIDKYKNFKSQ